ncbi:MULTISPECIES: 50S ribosomal protein L31e [Halobacterium]|uniref:Large ribosomal subunit protein eL31 n=5 Tax=Halobacterium salinarum TaxID=2242 RepID=RL31_HALSA|nr:MULTISPECIES: 50S ribosomal protein L31e [Halobacterium]B0R7X8.1 RecName: Full=Large ribosomal subunit protein eL31; AltName: Full=50S ribosomal protein L31e [Halobacterium salinarum R1]Q9HMN0.3 RecName: Full=Large ribosomal subunit protein eL31; AltName: Full=50S ribosomal protein L31e [Halobacterium salinarum NRC-1]AAG20541.1 50S ribosomal protein L31E [Halobacterium salinarum NRC-1]MBB6089528.1 large subunit ribosomal protein L31e [Halobacterium salinarum]MCF2164278.1 50S ribosomal prote
MSASEFDDRFVTVPLRDVTKVPSHERAGEAMNIIRQHLAKQFAVDEDAVRLDPSINDAVWSEGNNNPPRKLRVHAGSFAEDGETVVEADYEG